jgi:hypothetical protein
MAERPIFAYVKYNSAGVTALICPKCMTALEAKRVMDPVEGIMPIYVQGTVTCARCREVA